jgi:predicted component of type VI protein secretion system
MKVSLVVATGVHQGKVVPIVGTQFLIGRDPQCQLRPASQAVSKQHCAVIVRDGKVYLKDYGSTNGTVLNEAIVQNEERQINNHDSLKIGPLDFTVSIEATAPRADGTPLPEMNPETSAALAAVKAVAGASTASSKNATPSPAAQEVKPGSKEARSLKTGSKETPALLGPAVSDETENDRLAAMLLGLDDGEVPGGSTVVDVPLPAEVGAEGEAKTGEKPADKKAMPTREDTSSAASEILRKYMRRPR